MKINWLLYSVREISYPMSPFRYNITQNSYTVFAGICCCLTAACLWTYYSFVILNGVVIDDAYIVLRHARNLANGHGLNFNSTERVEGYTSFLYAILQSIPYFLKLDPVLFTRFLGLFTLGGLLLSSFWLARQIVSPWMAPLVPLALAISANVECMAVWGLETVAYSAFLTAGLAAAIGQRAVTAGILMALAGLTRMEAALPAAITGVYMALPLWRNIRSGNRIEWIKLFLQSRAFGYGAAFGLIFIPYFLLRAAYYDAWMPNTYTSKVGTLWQMAPRGLRFIISMYGRPGFFCIPPILLAGTWQLARLTRKAGDMTILVPEQQQTHHRGALWLLLIILACYHLYIIRVGGDYYPTFHDRFLVHFYGVLYVSLFWCIEIIFFTFACRIEGFHHPRLLTTFIGWIFVGITGYMNVVNPPDIEYSSITGWKTLGLYLKANSPPDATLAVDAAGAIPYFSELPTIDILGKADRHIGTRIMPQMGQGVAAHEKGDPAYVLRQAPLWVTTWINSFGQAQRHFADYYDFRTHYQLTALVNMTRNDIDPARIRFLASADLDNGLLKHFPEEGEAWGLFRKLDVPLEGMPLNVTDIESDASPWLVTKRFLFNHKATPSDLVTLSPKATGPAFRSIPIHFAPGRYILTATLACDPADDLSDTPIGHIDIRINENIINTRLLTCHDRLSEVAFTVAPASEDTAMTLWFYGEGGRKIHIAGIYIRRTKPDTP